MPTEDISARKFLFHIAELRLWTDRFDTSSLRDLGVLKRRGISTYLKIGSRNEKSLYLVAVKSRCDVKGSIVQGEGFVEI